MAFLILKPASWFLSPRALHSVNAFLIKATALPHLLAITVYERYLKPGAKIRQTSKNFFKRLPEHIRQMPFLDVLVGSSHSDIYDAILDMDVVDPDFFLEVGDEEDSILGTRHSKENLATTSSHSQTQEASFNFPSSPTIARRRTQLRNRVSSTTRLAVNPTVDTPQLHTRSLSSSARERKLGEENYGAASSGPSLRLSIPRPGNCSSGMMSPLARLFSNRTSFAADQTLAMNTPEASLNAKKVEALIEGVKDLPIAKLSEEMKELQVSDQLLDRYCSI
jgi:hypothetical protein